MILDWGLPIEKIKLLSILASKEGLASIQNQFPQLEIVVAAIDETLTNKGGSRSLSSLFAGG